MEKKTDLLKSFEEIINEKMEKRFFLQLDYQRVDQEINILKMLTNVPNNGDYTKEYHAYESRISEFEDLFNNNECLKLDSFESESTIDKDYLFLLDNENMLIINAKKSEKFGYVPDGRNLELRARILPIAGSYGENINKNIYLYLNPKNNKMDPVKANALVFYFSKAETIKSYRDIDEIDSDGKIYLQDLLKEISLEDIITRVIYGSNPNRDDEKVLVKKM